MHVHFDDVVAPVARPEWRGNTALQRESDEQVLPLTLTIPETAKLLGISLSKAYEVARLGQLPTIRVGTRLLVSRRRLEQMIDGRS